MSHLTLMYRALFETNKSTGTFHIAKNPKLWCSATEFEIGLLPHFTGIL